MSKPAKDIVIEDNSLSFKAGSAWSNWNIMQTIDRGVFRLEEKEGDVILTYEFFMYKLFIYTSIMALAMGIVSQKIWAGVGAFLWLCGMNWIIGVMRHRGLLDELAADIDSFINEKKAGGSVHPKV